MSLKNINASATRQSVAHTKFARRSFLLIISKLMRVGIQLFILFLYSRKLSYNDYGQYQSIWLYVNILSVFGLFGLPSILLSISNSNILSWVKENKIIFLFSAFALNTIPLLYIYATGPEYNTTIWILLIFITLTQNISIIVETIAVKKENEILVLISNIIFTIAYLLCHVIVLLNGYSLPILLSAIILSFLIKSIVIIFADKNLLITDTYIPVSNLGKQWLHLGLFDIISVIGKWLDKWIILLFLSFAQFGIYFNGAYEIPLFSLMVTSIGNVMVIESSKNNINKSDTNKSMFTNSSLLIASVAFPSFAFLLFYYHDFFTLIFTTKYTASIPIFFITIFIIPIRITNYSATLQAYNRNDLVAKAAIIDLIAAIVLMAILYPLLQMKGLALSFVVATYIQTGYYLWQTSKVLQEKVTVFFPVKKLLLLLVLSVSVLGCACLVFSKLLYPINMIGGGVVCMLLIIILLYIRLRKNNFILLN